MIRKILLALLLIAITGMGLVCHMLVRETSETICNTRSEDKAYRCTVVLKRKGLGSSWVEIKVFRWHGDSSAADPWKEIAQAEEGRDASAPMSPVVVEWSYDEEGRTEGVTVLNMSSRSGEPIPPDVLFSHKMK
ncbi:MAG TPA: hypothetical protein PLP01_17125 [Phycisphaerae bacterium]|nr:hypothetical protein [Phycisphaerae bacterium]HOI56977.1 hypothetical protein [Phycisphaerae bacterium]